MNHSFIFSLIGIMFLIGVFFIFYAYYRRRLAVQAMHSLRGKEDVHVMSLGTFISVSFICFVVLSVVVIYVDVTVSAHNFVSECAIELDDSSKCINSMGRKIFVSNQGPGIREQYANYEKRDDTFYTSLNAYLFHNVVIKTNDSNFLIGDDVELRIIHEGKSSLQVEYINRGKDVYHIEAYRPINVWSENKLSEFKNADVIEQDLEAGSSVVVKYEFDSLVDRVRIYKHTYTLERVIR